MRRRRGGGEGEEEKEKDFLLLPISAGFSNTIFQNVDGTNTSLGTRIASRYFTSQVPNAKNSDLYSTLVYLTAYDI